MSDRPRLVAARASGRDLAALVEEIWARGDAVLPLDPAAPHDRVLAAARPDALAGPDGHEEALADPAGVEPGVAAVVATSGTTGAPKLVELTHAALEASARASLARLGAGPGDLWLCMLPLHHVAGLQVLVRSRVLGAPAVVRDGFDPVGFDAEREATMTSVVPTMLRRLLDDGADLTRWRAILVGGAPPPPGLLDRARAAGANVVVTYGMTETCGGCVYDGVPLDGVEVRVGETIEIRGPVLMRGYRGEPGAGLRDGWFVTADAGEIDADGRLRVLGRVDDVITTGGVKVSPAAVEAVLLEHPGIADAAVFGVADDEWGQRVVAVVAGDAPPGVEDLRAWARDRLSPAELPREVRVVAAIPRTASGTVRRADLPGS